MMSVDTFVLIAFGVLCFLFGWHIRGITILKGMLDKPDEMIGLLTQLKNVSEQEKRLGIDDLENIIELEFEQHNNVLYAYDKLTGQFVAQGSTEKELLEIAEKRFPNKQFWTNNSK